MATSNKYDRQLRLWGAKGQKALSETTVVLIRATAAGTETLKNLVLPGVGHIHVIDDVNSIPHQDVAANFFLSETVGRTRAQVACEMLRELNPDVQGTYYHSNEPLETLKNWGDILHEGAGQNMKQILVIASDLEPGLLHTISAACNQGKLPLISVTSYGLIGVVRLQCPPMALLDPKPTESPPDLRLVQSFPALNELALSIEWESLENHQHGHVPYPLILLHAGNKWKETHGGSLPKTFAEKQEFRKTIESMSRDMDKELNFQEAVQNSYLAYTERALDHLAELADVDKTSSLGLLLDALSKFTERHGRPPINGSIPDMTASTEIYVKLQNIYRAQASQDLQEMKALLEGKGVEEEDIVSFCANVFTVGRLKTRSIADEFSCSNLDEELVEDWNAATFDPYEDPEHTPILWYLGIRACQLFHSNHGRFPGTCREWESDIPILQDCLVQVATDYKLNDNELVSSSIVGDKDKKMAHELARYSNAEIHNISSVIGGVASQEAVKLITSQYVPLDNTYVYNGIVSVGGVYRF